jgi:hypothetical protein
LSEIQTRDPSVRAKTIHGLDRAATVIGLKEWIPGKLSAQPVNMVV